MMINRYWISCAVTAPLVFAMASLVLGCGPACSERGAEATVDAEDLCLRDDSEEESPPQNPTEGPPILVRDNDPNGGCSTAACHCFESGCTGSPPPPVK